MFEPTPKMKMAPSTPSSPSSRMSLANVKQGRSDRPVRATLYSPEGVGKTTFAAGAPSPIFIGAEDGTLRLEVARFPTPETWKDVLDAVRVLELESHPYRTLAIDTLDWAEPLVWRALCQRAGCATIEDFGGGFQKGYAAAVDEWRLLLAALERLQAAKPINVLLLAHSQVKGFRNPEGEDYDRYELKLHPKASGVIKEWSDAVLFANHEVFARKEKRAARARGVSTGARLLYTERTAAYDAKNRYGLPPTLPLDWEEFESAVKRGEPGNADELSQTISGLVLSLRPEDAEKAKAALDRAGKNATKLSQLLTWVNAKRPEEAANNA